MIIYQMYMYRDIACIDMKYDMLSQDGNKSLRLQKLDGFNHKIPSKYRQKWG